LARTKRTKAGHTFKGGIVSYQQVRKDVVRLLNDSSADDFPGKSTLPSGTPYQRVHHLEQAFKNDIGARRFLPFLVLHEFEAFVLADPTHLASVLPQNAAALSQLQRQISDIPPEEINEGKRTHPAARIRRYFPGYRKRLHGPLVVERIGMASLRNKCPHLDAWLTKLEALCKGEKRE